MSGTWSSSHVLKLPFHSLKSTQCFLLKLTVQILLQFGWPSTIVAHLSSYMIFFWLKFLGLVFIGLLAFAALRATFFFLGSKTLLLLQWDHLSLSTFLHGNSVLCVCLSRWTLGLAIQVSFEDPFPSNPFIGSFTPYSRHFFYFFYCWALALIRGSPSFLSWVCSPQNLGPLYSHKAYGFGSLHRVQWQSQEFMFGGTKNEMSIFFFRIYYISVYLYYILQLNEMIKYF